MVIIGGKEKPILFPTDLTHSSVAHQLGFQGQSIVSAGFVSLDSQGKPACYGKSLSLHLRSRSQDTDVVMQELG